MKNYNKENYKYKNRLRELRIANGFTSMQALCDHMRDVMGYKISKSVIEKLERHEKEDAQMQAVIALAECFGVSCDYLMGIDMKVSPLDVMIHDTEEFLVRLKKIKEKNMKKQR